MKMDIAFKTIDCDLKSCFLCRLCLKDWLRAIAANKKTIKVKRGQQLFKEGEPVTGIYFVNAGVVKVHQKWDNEKELIIRFARQGDVLGVLGLGDDTRYPVSTTVLENGSVCYVELAFFESTLRVNVDLMYQLMMFFANELRASEKRMRNFAHMSVKGRIAHGLIGLKKQFGLNGDGFINLGLTRQELASLTGAAYETVFRMLNELVQQGLIVIDGKFIRIANETDLLKLVEENGN